MNLRKHILLLLMLIPFYKGYCQIDYKNGSVFINSYSEVDLANDQIWTIEQDIRGVMYFGTTSGIVEYDGLKWQLIDVSNNSSVLSFDIDSLGTIYVGATGEFGFLAIDTLGAMQYFSLKNFLDSSYQSFTDVWVVKATSNGVYFVTRNYVFRWHNKQMSVVKSPLDKNYGIIANDDLFVLKFDVGIYVVDQDSVKYLPFSKHILSSSEGFVIVPFIDDKLLFVTHNQIYEYNYSLVEHYSENYADEIDSTLFIKPFNVDFSRFLNENSVYSSIMVNDNLFVLGTIHNGILFFNAKGEFLYKISKNEGLPDNTILSLFIDKTGELWAGTNNGISRIEINFPQTTFNDKNGLEGSVLATIEHKGVRYAGTIYGIFRIDEHIEGEIKSKEFISLSKSKVSCWDFVKYDDILFASGANGLEIVEYNSTIEVLETRAIFCFGKTDKFSNTIFLGMIDSFGYFQIEKDKQTGKRKYQNYNKIENINETIRIIAQDSLNNLWASSEYKGIYYIEFPDNNLENAIVTNYDTTDGLKQMDFNYIYNIYNKILVGSSNGLYTAILNEVEGGKKYKFIPDTTFGKIFTDEENSINDIKIDNNGDIWIYANYGLGKVRKINNHYVWDTVPFQRLNGFAMSFDDNNDLWVNDNKGLYKFDLNRKYDYGIPFHSIIRKVTAGKNSVLFKGNYFDEINKLNENGFSISFDQPELLKPNIDYKNNSITFLYTAAYYIESDDLLFKYILKGFDEDWSDWTKESKKEYTNLPEGEYSFIVKTKNIYGSISNSAQYEFKILSPWYRTIYAYFGYLVIIAIIFYLVLQLYAKRLKAANIKLEKIVKERTAKIERQKINILERNIEISIQKEEIELQSKQLEKSNKELAKLSIVASKTDNAVVIMDAEGKFEWINEGFTRMYGYTLEELINERGDTIFKTSSNAYVKDLIQTCVTNKETVLYESMVIPHEGNNIWAQTTLTPIIDENDKVIKLIAIDTDIGQIKTAEIEISNQKEELLAQSEMLAEINVELERNHILITDSISYAKRIQEAILPTEAIIKKYFPESFIFFKPKDIVSGDFFWFLKPETNEWGKANNKIFIATVDCTGHGVPGAFMSMIGNTLLNEIVGNDKIFKPSEILDNLNAGIIELLKQREYHEESQDDGMDITICKIDPDIGELEIALANHNAYFKVGDELKSIEGDIYSIGGFFAKRFKPKFTNHVLEIDENSILYMFSDGYKDQFGGENKQKFIETRFKKMLVDNMNLNLNKQLRIIEDTFNEWKGDNKQIDDVMVLGLKFSGLDDLY